jgi:hypothetical protein
MCDFLKPPFHLEFAPQRKICASHSNTTQLKLIRKVEIVPFEIRMQNLIAACDLNGQYLTVKSSHPAAQLLSSTCLLLLSRDGY